jgi:hypothetical protein
MSGPKAVIVVDPGLPLGLLANTVAYLALTLGQRMPLLVGPDVIDGSGQVHKGTSAVPLPILGATAAQLAAIHQGAEGQPELLALSFTDAAQTSLTYEAYQSAIALRPTQELVYLGVALYGSRRRVNALTGNLPLLRV